jgi:hypothetical protein
LFDFHLPVSPPCSVFAFQLTRTHPCLAPSAPEWPGTLVSGPSWPLARPPPVRGEGVDTAQPPHR